MRTAVVRIRSGICGDRATIRRDLRTVSVRLLVAAENPQLSPDLLASTGALTVAALRLGLRVAMMPTLREIRSADVRVVAGRCPPGSRFAAAVAGLTAANGSGR